MYAGDIDGDSDLDILSASAKDPFSRSIIAWHENVDGQGSFGRPEIINDRTEFAQSVYMADLDGDGDLDVLSASALDDTVAWYKNTDGTGAFSPQQVITTAAEGAR